MIIESITLHNIKSYDGQGETINFRPGVNLIWGKNGSGKTTILEAIGYCLFDALDYNLDQFRREGETDGEIILTFKHRDERSYSVIREIRTSGGLKIQDVDSGRFLFRKRKDAEDWLNEELGVEFGKYGKHLFQNAIGVSQGKMVGSFVVSAGPRKTIFDPILRVDEYEQAYKQLAATKNHLSELLKTNQIEQSRLKGLLDQLPNKKTEFSELTEKILAGERDLNMMQEQRDSLQQELTLLDQVYSKLLELDGAISASEQKLESLSSQLQMSATALEESKKAHEIVASSEKGYKEYERASQNLASLEIQKSQYEQILKDVQAIEVTLSGLNQKIADFENRLNDVEQAERKLTALEPEVEKQSTIELRIEVALRQVEERQRLLKEITNLENQIKEKNSSLETLHTQVLQRLDLENELRENTLERANLSSALDAKRLEISKKQSESETNSKKLQQALLDQQAWGIASGQRDELLTEIAKDQVNLVEYKNKVQKRQDLEREQESQERERHSVSQKIGDAQKEVALCKHKIEELKTHISLLRSAESAECPTCRRSLSEIEKDNVETDFANEEEKWGKLLQLAQFAEAETTQTSAQIEERLNEIQSLLKELPTEAQVKELKQTINSKDERLKGLFEKINLLSGAPGLVAFLQIQAKDFDEAIKEIKANQEELEQQRSQINQKIDQLQNDIALLPTATTEKGLEAEIQGLEAEVAVRDSTVEELVNSEQDLKKARTELEELGDPRAERHHWSRVLTSRPEIEKNLALSIDERKEASARKADLEKTLLPFVHLDGEINETKSILREFEQDHRDYERNLQTAQALSERQTGYDKLQQDQAEEKAKLDHFVADKNQEKAEYNSAYHQEIKNNYADIEAKINSKSTRLDEWQNNLQTLQAELIALGQQEAELEKIEAEISRLEKLSGIFEFVRNSIKRASPDIVRRRVLAVSQTAERIFQDILGDIMLTLIWDESYAVKVRSGEKERVFEQLSGGEKMAASIAVRLALLLHMADNNIRWLFLDEPTANMDNERRDKLADRITRLDQLDQIFVITHDDAFDRDTHHLIQIEKENGISTATSIR